MGALRNLDGRPVSERDLDALRHALMDRGPDGSADWCEGATGLVHTSLRTVPDASGAGRSLLAPEGDVALTADVRLDGRARTTDRLGEACPPDASDARVLLAAYRKWGPSCAEHLLGDFAFVAWDTRRRTLFAARDALGVKPFYYVHLPGRLFACASEIRPLLALPGVPRRLNETRLADYLAEVEDDRVATFYDGIQRLPPAHTLELRDGVVTIRCYWRPDGETELELPTDEAYEARFRAVFEAAVRDRMRAEGSVGVAMSGGLDSCSVACVARDLAVGNGGGDLPTFSLLYDGVAGGDERDYIRSVVRQGGIRASYVECARIGPLDHLDELLDRLEEPLNSPHYPNGWTLWRTAREHGLRALMDGVDGDVTVSYDFVYLAELARRGRLATMAREAVGISRSFWLERVSPFSIMWRRGIRPLLPASPRWLRRGSGSGNGLDDLAVGAELAGRTRLPERLAELRERRRAIRTAREYHCADVVHGVVAYALESTNKLASTWSIEPRHPFFDRRLVELCIALPRRQRIRDGWTRVVMRNALRDLLPDEVRWHGDKFDANDFFARRLRDLELERIDRVLADDAGVLEPWYDLAALRRVGDRFRATPAANDAYVLWRALVLSRWLRRTGLAA